MRYRGRRPSARVGHRVTLYGRSVTDGLVTIGFAAVGFALGDRLRQDQTEVIPLWLIFILAGVVGILRGVILYSYDQDIDSYRDSLFSADEQSVLDAIPVKRGPLSRLLRFLFSG